MIDYKNYLDISDSILIRNLKSKNQDTLEYAYECIYYKYAKLLFVCVNQIVKNNEDSEDIVNDTFLSIFNNREKLLEEKNLKYYLIVSAKNNAFNFINKKKLEVINNDDYIYEEALDNTSDIKSIITMLKEVLDTNEIELIINHVINEYTFKEIAQKENLSENTIKTKYYRAIEKVNKYEKKRQTNY